MTDRPEEEEEKCRMASWHARNERMDALITQKGGRLDSRGGKQRRRRGKKERVREKKEEKKWMKERKQKEDTYAIVLLPLTTK